MLMVLGELSGVLVSGGGKAFAATLQEWQELGNTAFSEGGAEYMSLYVDGVTPYVAYMDVNRGNKATVMKYDRDSNTWVSVGSRGFSTYESYYMTIKVADGTPYVAYWEYGFQSRGMVMKYDSEDNAWEPVGPNGFRDGFINNVSLYIADGIPYVAYSDVSNNGRLTVMKYDSNSDTWNTVGNPHFSASSTSYNSLYVASDGTPYVAYSDLGDSGKATVMKYDSFMNTWGTVGNASFSASNAESTSLYVASDGTPYVAYADGDNFSKATVMKYDRDSNAWVPLGNESISTGYAANVSLEVAPNGTFYVGYRDHGNSSKTTVMRYDSDSNTWVYVGKDGFSPSAASVASLSLASDGTPYMAYTDWDNSNNVTVMSYNRVIVPPALTADMTDNDTDHQIEITFTDDSVWRSNITEVKSGAVRLTEGTDYSVSAGMIQIRGDALGSGIHTITVKAQDFAVATVVQEVGKVTAEFEGGTGTSLSPYWIATADQLHAVRNYPVSFFKLVADIDLSVRDYSSEEGWWPIGTMFEPFRGEMDGNGYRITGLTINEPKDVAGLFAYTNDAVLTNMKLENVMIRNMMAPTGGLVGISTNSTISNSYVSGSVSGEYVVGGLVGISVNSNTISNSYVSGSVSGEYAVGGLVGNGAQSTISNSYAAGSVSGQDTVGGLIGYGAHSTISNSYATGDVSGDQTIGGLVGNGAQSTISNSYAAGDVSGRAAVGGLVSVIESGTISNSYATGHVTVSYSYAGGLVGFYSGTETIDNSFYDMDTTGQNDVGRGDGKSTAQMKTQSTYSDAGWDFENTWGIQSSHNKGYPYLRALQHFVTYDGNGSSAGDVPFDSNTYKSGDQVTVAGNTGSLVKEGYSFRGWNTAADGSGTTYAANDTFSMSSKDVTLYAQWNLLHVLTYDGNGETSGSVPADQGFYEHGATVSVQGNSRNLEKNGYVFAGWNTAADGSGTSYKADGTETFTMGAANVTLYAQWLSRNASLSSLSVDQGTLTPVFAPSGLTYSVDVPSSVTSLQVSLTPGDPNQALTVTGAVYTAVADKIYAYTASHLRVGPNLIQITVTAQDGTHSTYNLTVNRLSNNADLNGITLSSGTLSPAFAAGTTDYTASVANDVSSITVTASVYDSRSAMKVNGTTITSGQASGAIALNVGSNVITLDVTAQDGATTKTYKMTVTRASAKPSRSSSSGRGGGSSSTASSDKVTSTDGQLALPTGKTGEVSLGAGITLTIPADASSRELKVTIEKVEDTQKLLTSRDVLASPVFEILKNVPENFNKPVTLTFTFDQKSMTSGQTPSVFYYDEAKKVWVAIGGTVNGNTITVKVDHFTKFAVFGVGQDSESADDVHQPLHFNDISGHWAEANIKQAISGGIVSGYADGTFLPNRTVTRAEFAVMLMNALKPQGDVADLMFTDKAKIGAWAQKAVAQAVQAGIISGYEDGSFQPDAEITRTEMAAMIAKALGQPVEADPAMGFADDKDIPAWAKGAVAAMKKLGIIEGKDNNNFAPDDRTTRAEAITVLLNMLAHKEK
ncbi:S-layer homology domain-containing protein [Paenibacillus sp. y28]